MAKLSRYDGNGSYDKGQFYTVDRFTFSAVIPLADENNLLHFTSQYINRDYELDLLGFKDTLYRVAVEYIHYF
ncbi:hypothetical protein [Shewanella benthica]|uniref:Uncharacterized protein n=1 Tax=Shewanella benthica KT99 TaxID=314608 RepID=A9CY74_9GAMM|nr:hypothetical protein [Shewanella benthica]EDQ02421.1 hypothetical protein KT99_02872 [Shewanella benthica KT99]